MKISEWYGLGNTFKFGDFPIFYKDEGAGDVLLCLHGFPTASWDWEHIWQDLTTRFRVIAPDMLGYGYSAKPRKHTYSIYEQADLIEQLLSNLGINSIHILAHDYGDIITQELLARHLENPKFEIKSICLLNGGVFPETHRSRPIQKLLLKPILGSIITLFYNRQRFGKQFSEVFAENTQPIETELDDFWSLIERNNGHRIIHKLMHYVPENITYRERWVGGLEKNTLPLKVINGIDDPVSGEHVVKRFLELMPHTNVTRLEGIGHYPHVEAPEQTLSAYFEFLDNL